MAELPRAEIARDDEPRPRTHAEHKRRFRNILLDRKLQLRYVISVTLASVIISGSLGYLIWRQEHHASQMIMEKLEGDFETETFDPDLQRVVESDLSSGDHDLLLTMFAFGCSLVLVLSTFLLIMTHKVAGPLYKLSRHFDDLAAGRFRQVRPLRRFDMLRDFHHKFEDCHAAMRARLEAECEVGERAVAAAADLEDRPEKVDRALSALRLHLEKRREALG